MDLEHLAVSELRSDPWGPGMPVTVSEEAGWISRREAIRVDLLGVRIDGLSQRDTVEHILTSLGRRKGGWLITANVDIFRRLFRNPILRMLVARADLVVADGAPIVWACRALGSPVGGRVAGADLILALSEAAAEANRSVFVLGGAAGVADEAGRQLRATFPDLDVRGAYCPPWGFERSDQAMQGIIDALTLSAPDIVFCGLGFPKQERLILKLMELFPHTWFIGSGASHTFVAGQFSRAPRWMQRFGLEWLHRLRQEPFRLFRRYVVEDLPFALWLLAGSVLCRCVPKDSVLGPITERVRAVGDRGAAISDGRTGSSGRAGRHGNGHVGNGNGHARTTLGLFGDDPVYPPAPEGGADDDR